MDKPWTPAEVLTNPVSDALREELKHWEVKLTAEGKIKPQPKTQEDRP